MTDHLSRFRDEIPDTRAFLDFAAQAARNAGMPLFSLSLHWDGDAFSADAAFSGPKAAPAPAGSSETMFRAVTDGEESPYLLYLPPGFDPAKRYPAVLFLHGIGERGLPPKALSNYGPFAYVQEGHTLPFIVLAPVLEAGSHWVEDPDGNETDRQMVRLQAFIRDMLSRYPIDPDRLSLTGLSMGGRGAYKLACFMPDTFCAAAVCCGRAAPRGTPDRFHYPMENLRGLPLWIFHGLKDTVVDPGHALASARKMRESDPRGRLSLTLYPDIKHNCYDPAYRDTRLYAWLETSKRS